MYFKKIENLNDLKAKYRELALKNHPDVGGDPEIMKAINCEYDMLFPIWQRKFNASATVKNTETAQSTRSEFYTQYGWAGSNYRWDLSTTDIAKLIRQYVKTAYSDHKFSVTSKYFSGGSSINVRLMEAPYEVFTDGRADNDKYVQSVNYYLNNTDVLSDRAVDVLKDVQRFMDSYNMKDCDGMIDYFHVNFWDHLDIGKWDKPFKVVERKPKNKTTTISA